MNKRLQQFISAENISQSQFAEKIGVAKASVSHILAGRNKPGFEFIEGISQAFPDLNIEWLISGRGRMYKSREREIFDSQDDILLPEPALEAGKPAEATHRITKVVVFYDDGTYTELV